MNSHCRSESWFISSCLRAAFDSRCVKGGEDEELKMDLLLVPPRLDVSTYVCGMHHFTSSTTTFAEFC